MKIINKLKIKTIHLKYISIKSLTQKDRKYNLYVSFKIYFNFINIFNLYKKIKQLFLCIW